jgi:alkylation response protein AidB-like acyl-CoA dehydrogenase
MPGQKVGHLSQRAGDFVRRKSAVTLSVGAKLMVDVAERRGRTKDPLVRQQIARMHTEQEIGRFMALRHKALRAQKQDLPGFGNIAKLRTTEIFRLARDLGLSLLGPRGMLHEYTKETAASEDEAAFAKVTDAALWSPAPAIYGGTDEIQKNILSERVLGLPREPGDDRNTPFKELRKNA